MVNQTPSPDDSGQPFTSDLREDPPLPMPTQYELPATVAAFYRCEGQEFRDLAYPLTVEYPKLLPLIRSLAERLEHPILRLWALGEQTIPLTRLNLAQRQGALARLQETAEGLGAESDESLLEFTAPLEASIGRLVSINQQLTAGGQAMENFLLVTIAACQIPEVGDVPPGSIVKDKAVRNEVYRKILKLEDRELFVWDFRLQAMLIADNNAFHRWQLRMFESDSIADSEAPQDVMFPPDEDTGAVKEVSADEVYRQILPNEASESEIALFRRFIDDYGKNRADSIFAGSD